MTPDHLAELHHRAGDREESAVLRFIDDALRFYMEFHSRYDGFYGAFIHDALAVASALDPTLLRTELLAVQVELGGMFTSGETVTDWRRVWGREPNLDVAVAGGRGRILRAFHRSCRKARRAAFGRVNLTPPGR